MLSLKLGKNSQVIITLVVFFPFLHHTFNTPEHYKLKQRLSFLWVLYQVFPIIWNLGEKAWCEMRPKYFGCINILAGKTHTALFARTPRLCVYMRQWINIDSGNGFIAYSATSHYLMSEIISRHSVHSKVRPHCVLSIPLSSLHLVKADDKRKYNIVSWNITGISRISRVLNSIH